MYSGNESETGRGRAGSENYGRLEKGLGLSRGHVSFCGFGDWRENLVDLVNYLVRGHFGLNDVGVGTQGKPLLNDVVRGKVC